MTTLLAVDGNSLVHRAWHGGTETPRPGWVTARVVSLMAAAWQHAAIDAVLIGFDGPANRRKGWDPAYKAHRPDKDPGLEAAVAKVPDDLAACGFTVQRPDDAEADDVCAAAARQGAARGWSTLVLSSDRDLWQLVTDDVHVLRPGPGGLERLAPRDIEEETGVPPHQYRDLAVLRGDPSDGLPGVHGIGPKTAARLLRDYGDLDGIYAALSWLPPKVEAALRLGRETVAHNQRMMSPLTDVTADLDAAVVAGVDPARVDAALVPRGHGPAAGRFRHAVERGPLPPAPPPPDEPMLDDRAQAEAVLVAPAPIAIATPATDGEQGSLF